MKIRLVGFRLDLHKDLSQEALLQEVRLIAGTPYHFSGYPRIVSLAEEGKYIVGSVVTIKDLSKFPKINEKSYKLTVHELAKEEKLAAFNFFLIAKRNFNGLYAHYRDSMSLPVFGTLLDHFGKKATKPVKNAALKNVKEKGHKGKELKKEIREDFEKAVKWSYLASPEGLSEIVAKWKRVRALEYTVTELQSNQRSFEGLKPFVNAVKHRLGFEKDTVVSRLLQPLKTFIESLNYKRAKIEGTDEEGLDRTIDLIHTPEWFGEFDHQKTLSEASLFHNDVCQSTMIRALIAEANKRTEYFDIDVQ